MIVSVRLLHEYLSIKVGLGMCGAHVVRGSAKDLPLIGAVINTSLTGFICDV